MTWRAISATLYRQARDEVERNRRGAARHEADSIARYMAAQDQRDHARSLSDDRNERLRGERMQRLVEMQADDEAGTLAIATPSTAFYALVWSCRVACYHTMC